MIIFCKYDHWKYNCVFIKTELKLKKVLLIKIKINFCFGHFINYVENV